MKRNVDEMTSMQRMNYAGAMAVLIIKLFDVNYEYPEVKLVNYYVVSDLVSKPQQNFVTVIWLLLVVSVVKRLFLNK